MDIYLEIFGYIGTALVVISMLMTSVVRLRILNMCGGLISTVYSVFCNAWPIVLMNVILIIINLCQVVIYYRGNGDLCLVETDTEDSSFRYFAEANRDRIDSAALNGIKRADNGGKYLVFKGNEIVGFVMVDLSLGAPVIDYCYMNNKYGYKKLFQLIKADLSQIPTYS